ncbi:MAG: tyrosinase family protein [Saprospiraceae bacterium]|nr:tyrosinase family protein [Saprospiraceae bacterium]
MATRKSTPKHAGKTRKPHYKRHQPKPYCDHDYDDYKPKHRHKPPDNPAYPDPQIYGDYASKNPPKYVPHSYDHSCFRPRKEDYKEPYKCEDDPDPRTTCVRRDHRRLSTDEQNRFLNAFTQINNMGALGPLVDIHSNSVHQMHGNPRFLPWHRIYLLRLEELLQMVDPTVCLPYWRSSDEQAFPAWLTGFTPTVNLSSGSHTVTRNIGAFSTLPNTAAVNAAMSNGTYNSFASALEGIHDSGHVWVGGSMGLVPTAPCDPIFWMHHCEIDRIWAEWQAANPGQNPSLSGASAVMDPWSESETDTRDIAALGYSYA